MFKLPRLLASNEIPSLFIMKLFYEWIAIFIHGMACLSYYLIYLSFGKTFMWYHLCITYFCHLFSFCHQPSSYTKLSNTFKWSCHIELVSGCRLFTEELRAFFDHLQPKTFQMTLKKPPDGDDAKTSPRTWKWGELFC